MFGKSITRRAAPPARHLEPVPPLPLRPLVLAAFAVLACVYAIVRHAMAPPPAPTPTPSAREIPAPDLVPLEK